MKPSFFLLSQKGRRWLHLPSTLPEAPDAFPPGFSGETSAGGRSRLRGARTLGSDQALGGSDEESLLEVTGRSAASLEILARALHVKNAELEPTLEAITATAVTMLSP